MLILFNLNIFVFCVLLMLMVAFLVLLERKFLGLIQERKGPNVVSIMSILQTILDSVKLLTKKCYENYMSMYFLVLPMLGLFLSFSHWVVVPIPYLMIGSDFTIILSFVIMGLMAYVVLSCGYVSSSSYGIIGSIRSVAQMISYEVVFMLYILSFMFLFTGYSWKIFGSFELIDNTFIKIFYILTWTTLTVSELNRTPFDLVEGESELVSGYNVEYSSFSFTLLFLSEYMNIWFMSVLFCVIFISSNIFFIFLVLFYSSYVVFIRSLLPRFKFNQLISLMWKVFLPSVFIFLFYFMMLSK